MRRAILIAIAVMFLIGVPVTASPNHQANAFELFLLEVRNDLETLANDVWGIGRREAANWTFNADLTSPTMIADLWYDNEQLADAIFGVGVRPPVPDLLDEDWFGATTGDPFLLTRNIRHDLELSAKAYYEEDYPPEGWIGALKIYQCDRTLQNVTRLLDSVYNAGAATSQSAFDYCGSLRLEVEDELLPVMYNTVESGGPEIDAVAEVSTIRGDLERLANELCGVHRRPESWSGNLDEESSSMAYDLDVDMGLLANLEYDPNNPSCAGFPETTEIGPGVRPEGWKLYSSTSLIITARNLRHNLEMFADITLGDGVRPHGWQGTAPMLQCSLLDQGLVVLVQRQFEFVIDEALVGADDFCEQVVADANHLAENPPIPEEGEEEESLYTAESEYAFAYLDAAALDYMGIMPKGVEFRAWYRNFNESTMMFVSGQNFAVFIDRRWTTLDPDIFSTLPTLEGVQPRTFCDAEWCSGPGPTPTPTGGALMAVITHATPVATPDVGEGPKTQVSWNHIRVTYLLDRPETGTVQVALEICAELDQINCEPVISVFDNAIGAQKPVLSQFNGLNVYEFRYGYNSNVIIEGLTYISPDIWISDPTIR